MVRIRLQRHGRKKRPYYHIVAADIRSKRDGRIIEDLGRFNPIDSRQGVTVNTERVIFWLQNGAQPSDTVRNLLKNEGVFYHLHLIRWGKSAEEIEKTISEWKETKNNSDVKSSSEVRKARIAAEAEVIKKQEAQEAEKAAKKAKEEKEKAEAEAEAKTEAEAEAQTKPEKTEKEAVESSDKTDEAASDSSAEAEVEADETVAEESADEEKKED